jgi:hypothetical protein
MDGWMDGCKNIYACIAIEFGGVAAPTYYSLRPTGSLLMPEPEHHVVRLHFASHRGQVIHEVG